MGLESRDGVDLKLRSKRHNPNKDLELDPDSDLTPKNLTSLSTHMVIRTLDGSSCKNV